MSDITMQCIEDIRQTIRENGEKLDSIQVQLGRVDERLGTISERVERHEKLFFGSNSSTRGMCARLDKTEICLKHTMKATVVVASLAMLYMFSHLPDLPGIIRAIFATTP